MIGKKFINVDECIITNVNECITNISDNLLKYYLKHSISGMNFFFSATHIFQEM